VELRLLDYVPDELRKNIRFIVLGALAFGIGGYPLGVGMYQEGSSIIFLPIIFFIVTAFWGCILGLPTKKLKNVMILAGTGLIGGVICLVVGNLGGLIILALMGWLLILAPPIFLIMTFYYYRKKENIISVICLLFFIYVVVDWLLIFLNKTILTGFSMFSLHAFVYALTGLILGGSFGLVIGKTKIMAIFGLIGFSLGSYWIGIMYHLFENTNRAVYSVILTYILLSVTAGAFLVAGLYYQHCFRGDDYSWN